MICDWCVFLPFLFVFCLSSFVGSRQDSSFVGKLFKDYWNFTYYPSDPRKFGNNNNTAIEYLEYPHSNIWQLSMIDPVNDPCGMIQWTHTFTIDELLNTCGFEWGHNDNGDDGGVVDLKGEFYLTGISPDLLNYSPIIDRGSYLTQIIASDSLHIQFTKASSINDRYNDDVSLFSNNIISVKVETTFREIDNTFTGVFEILNTVFSDINKSEIIFNIFENENKTNVKRK